MPPKLVYDDDCHFCARSATYAARRSDVVPVPLSEVLAGDSPLTEAERARLPDGFEECAHLLTDDAVHSCGAAIERSLVSVGVVPEEIVEFLTQFEDYRRLRERLYERVSRHRVLLSNVFGPDPAVDEDPDSEPGSGERPSEEG